MDWRETPATLARARAEEPVVFAGANGPLFGMFTPPAPDASLAKACVVLPGRPRSGVRRLLVLAARILATEGFAVLRFDLRGHGESAGNAAPPSRQEPLGEDVIAAVHHLRKAHGQKRLLLAGYCFDGLSALNSFKDDASAIDGLFLAAATVLEERPGANNLVRTMMRQARAPKILDSFETPFAALARSNSRALFLYGEQDRLRAEFHIAEKLLFSRLDSEARARLQVEIWPGRIHTIESQPAIIERAISWLREFHAVRNPSRDS